MSEKQHQISWLDNTNPDANVVAMIELLEQLSEVIGEENRHLQSGLPASMSGTISRKSMLANELERWVRAVKTNEIVIAKTSPALREKLVTGGVGLNNAMSENATRLKAAIAATRSRVNAVMYAVREQGQFAGGYCATGHARVFSKQQGNAGRLI